TIDVITGNTVTGFHTLRDSDIAAARGINHIAVHNGLAYLATAYGVVVFDVAEKQIKETWRDLGPTGESLAINVTSFLGDSVFLASANSLLVGNITQNLLDFNNWKRFDTGLFADGVSSVATFDNSVYVATGGGVYRYSEGVWSEPILSTVEVKTMTASDNHLFVVGNNTAYSISGEIVTQVQDPLITSPTVIQEDIDGNLWIGDERAGLLSNASGPFIVYRPDGPSSNFAFKLVYNAGRMFTVPGGFNSSGEPHNNAGEVNVFQNGQWTTIAQPIGDLTDIVFMNDKMFVSSFGEGIAITDEQGNTSIPEDINTLLNTASGNQPKVTALERTPDGLWIALYDGTEPVYFLSNNGSAEPFSFGLPNEEKPFDTSTDGNGNLWIALSPSAGGGLIAFDVRNDKAYFKTDVVGQGGLPHENVNALAVDREGYTWIGTDAGVAYFLSPSQDALKPIYENRFLLRDEKITAIEVDGGNRKWIGTERGAWLFNDSGERLIDHFTKDNSPLLSDNIQDIEIDPQTGEVFISSDAGLVSYRSDATEASSAFEAVKIFPNPVHPGYSGLVAISGLTEDAEVKITDISGKLLWQARASGGTASWNLRDHRGNRATTGVYLVFAISQDGRESVVGKVAIIQ
ncbi:MAG TPA: two-component regulator propeller domain-containing protein, partial [Chryseosolibacter sp.]|nr:two-component regulator propeller domain-containing protein [Chryseosolibacter sp.]